MSAVDLSALRMEEQPIPPRIHRRRGPRMAVLGIALLACVIAATFLWPVLFPPREVTTAPVRLAGGASAARAAVAEAAGWIEPEPYAVTVRPLVEGVLQELLVLEGAEVKAGETVIARLQSAALLAARDRAKASLLERTAEAERVRIVADALRAVLEQRGDLRAEEARARGELEVRRRAVDSGKAGVVAAEAALEARRADLQAQELLAERGGSYPVALARARAAAREAEAMLELKRQELKGADAEVVKSEQLLSVAQDLLRSPRALEKEAAEAVAELRQKEAARDAATTELAIAEREIGWCEVRAPADGAVLKLLAAPGAVVGPAGEGIVSIYDPARLQARIDVPLSTVSGVAPGQEVEMRTDVFAGRVFHGVVIRVQRESDLLKNTLQVKVHVTDPDPLLRPETLVRARFAAREGAEAAPVVALFRIPRSAARGDAVFVVDPRGGGRARRVAVERVGEEGEELIVRGELSVSHRVILDPVEDGDRVKEVER